jgi:hypothetical protein
MKCIEAKMILPGIFDTKIPHGCSIKCLDVASFFVLFLSYFCRDIRQHDNSKQEWSDEELKKLYETHERLLDFVSLFCFVPRAKYLPLGPTRYVLCI